MIRLFLAVCLLFVPSVFVFAQQPDPFVPALAYPLDSAAWIKQQEEKLVLALKQIDGHPDEKYLAEAYSARTTALINRMRAGRFLWSGPIKRLVDSVTQEIKAGNPNLFDTDIQVLVSTSHWPNASTWGEGTIMINVGLIRSLENPSQLAFIICHELAHQAQQHANKQIEDQIWQYKRKGVKKKLKQIKRGSTKQWAAAIDLLRKLVYDDRRHGREHEYEADSLGLIYLQQTRFDPQAALSALALMDIIDERAYKASIPFDTILNFPEAPFDSTWVKGESSFISGNTSFFWETDSLKTHPDCQNRIIALAGRVQPSLSKRLSLTFEQIQPQADFESIYGAYRQENYGQALLEALNLHSIYPYHPFPKAMVGLCLYEIGEARNNHTLSQVVPFPTKSQYPNYQAVLRMIRSLSRDELSAMAYYYVRTYIPDPNQDEHGLMAYYLTAKLREIEPETSAYKAAYLAQFSEGRYQDYVRD